MSKKEPKRETVERGAGYLIYYSEGRFFVERYQPITHSYETLAGARESLYYAGLRDTKD